MIDFELLGMALGVSPDDHAIIVPRAFDAYIFIADVAQDHFRIAVQRISPAATPTGLEAERAARIQLP